MGADMNLMSVTMQEFLNLVREAILDEEFTTPILCLGKTGIGKTESIFSVTKELGIGYKELRLINYTETDLIGIPTVEKLPSGVLVARWAQMGRLPVVERDGEVGIMVLDEITSASDTVRAAAFQLMDSSRSVGDYKLPEKWLIVALGNGPDDGGVFKGLEYAFLGRCLGVRVEPDFNSWKNWALNNGVHPAVVGFLAWQPQYIHDLNLEAEYAEKAPSPRAWTKLSIKLINAEKRVGGTLDRRSVEVYAAAAVGNKLAPTFAAFYSYKNDVVSAEEILNGKGLDKIPDLSREILYFQIHTVVAGVNELLNKTYIPDEVDWPESTYKQVANACKWAIAAGKQRLDVTVGIFNELQTSCKNFCNMIIDDKFSDVCPEFDEFGKEHMNVFRRKGH